MTKHDQGSTQKIFVYIEKHSSLLTIMIGASTQYKDNCEISEQQQKMDTKKKKKKNQTPLCRETENSGDPLCGETENSRDPLCRETDNSGDPLQPTLNSKVATVLRSYM